MNNIEIAVLLITIIILSGVIAWIELRRPRLQGDFSSFDLGCPEKGCGWYFQTKADLDEHIKQGKHGV